jgi:hypothetical protein
MPTIRALFYADTEATLPHCVVAAEMLRNKLEAEITMVVFDRRTLFDKAFENYDVLDHESLFRLSAAVSPTAAGKASDGGGAGTTANVTASRDANAACKSGAGQASCKEARRRSGLRKFLSRSKTLKKVFGILRRSKAWPTYARNLAHRSRTLLVLGQSVQHWYKSFLVRRFLRTNRPDIMVFAEDNVERLSMVLISEGRRQGIPSIVIPFTIPNPLEPAKAYRDRKSNQARGPLAWLLVALYPKWRFCLNGQDLLRLPAFTALVLEMLGQSSPAPWVLNRGGAARIALDSEAQRDTYFKLGFPAAQLSVVGDIYGQMLHQALINKSRLLPDLLAKHGLPPGRPLILCGFPPDQFGRKTNDFEFSDYDTLVEAWVESFRLLGDRANILVRPHPRVDMRRFEGVDAPNIRFTSQPTAELIPLCDLYVASISATIRWAIACGIPVIDYDTYRYRYGDYDTPGTILVETLAEFRNQLTRFADDPSFAADLAERQRSVMHHWGLIDAGLAERLSALVSEVIAQSKMSGVR